MLLVRTVALPRQMDRTKMSKSIPEFEAVISWTAESGDEDKCVF